MGNNDDALRMEGITKGFPGVLANDQISLNCRKKRSTWTIGRKWRWKDDIDEYSLWASSTRRREDLYQRRTGDD